MLYQKLMMGSSSSGVGSDVYVIFDNGQHDDGYTNNFAYSSDGGVTWNTVTLDPNLRIYKIHGAKGNFVINGRNISTNNNYLLKSTDLINWTDISIPNVSSINRCSVSCSDTFWIITFQYPNFQQYYSTNFGASWTMFTQSIFNISPAWVNYSKSLNMWHISSNGSTATSYNTSPTPTTSWTNVTGYNQSRGVSIGITDVNGSVFACCSTASDGYYNSWWYVSTNGINFTRISSAQPGYMRVSYTDGVGYINGKYFLLNSTPFVGTDLVNFNFSTMPNYPLPSSCTGISSSPQFNSLVMIDSQGYVVSTNDGTNWTSRGQVSLTPGSYNPVVSCIRG